MDSRDTGDINRNTGAALAKFVEDHQADINVLSERLGEIEKAIDWATSAEEWKLVVRLTKATSFLYHNQYVQGTSNAWPTRVQQGLEASRQINDGSSEAKFTQHLALISQLQGELAEAEQLAEKALSLRRATGDSEGEAETLFLLAGIAESTDVDRASDLYLQAARIAEETDNRILSIRSWLALGELSHRGGDLDQAESHYAACLRECGGADEPDFPLDASQALYALGVINSNQGNLRQAREQLQNARSLAERAGDHRGQARTFYQLAKLIHADGDLAMAERYYTLFLTFCQETSDEAMEISVRSDLGNLALARGNWSDATRHLQDALKAAERLSIPDLTASVNLNLGILLRKKGALEDAFRHLEAALRMSEGTSGTGIRPLAQAHFARLLLETDEVEQAIDLLHQSIKSSQEMKQAYPLALAKTYLALALERDGSVKDALQLGSEGVGIMRDIGAQLLLVEGLRMLGQIQWAANRRSKAHKSLTESLKLAQRIGMEHDVLLARQVLADLSGAI